MVLVKIISTLRKKGPSILKEKNNTLIHFSYLHKVASFETVKHMFCVFKAWKKVGRKLAEMLEKLGDFFTRKN